MLIILFCLIYCKKIKMMIGAGVLIGCHEDRIDLGCHDPFSITTALSDLFNLDE